MILKQRIDNCGRPLTDWATDVENIFEHMFGDGPSSASTLSPRANVDETEVAYRIELELPGVSPDQVTVELTDGVLEVFGEKTIADAVEDTKRLKSERRGGEFRRSFKFATQLEADGIAAEFRNGVLEITLPKAEQVLPRKIDIKIGQ